MTPYSITTDAELNEKITHIYVGSTGQLDVLGHDGQTYSFVGVPAGDILRLNVRQVLSSSTAGDFVGLG